MSRGTAADNSFTPAKLESLFETASRVSHRALQDRHEYISIQLAFLIYMMGYLGFRLGFVLHFDSSNVIRDGDGEIKMISVPTIDECTRGDNGGICKYCQKLAEAQARNADDDSVSAEDFFAQYWGPKSAAGNRELPVCRERGREIIELFLEHEGSISMSAENVRRRLTLIAEITEGIDPKQMTPQALRASAANYWINFRPIDPEALKTLMGWKYLSTAHYYVRSSSDRLRHKMYEALEIEADTQFDVEKFPPTYSELRSDTALVEINAVTPDSEITRHRYENAENPLEKEAQENRDSDTHQSTVSAFTEQAKAAIDPITPAVRSRLHNELNDLRSQPSPPHVAAVALGSTLTAVFMGALFSHNGFLRDLLAGDQTAIATGVAAVAIVLPWMIWDIVDTHYDDPRAVDPPTTGERIFLWIHHAFTPVGERGRQWVSKVGL